MYSLGDIFIGNFEVTQSFGARPDIYGARYGLKGHNGVDFGTPSLTLILSAADGWVFEIGSKELGTFDEGGYGNYIKIVHGNYLTLYGHLNDIAVKKGDHVVAGQLIAHSNNTGYSDAPHLHFGVAPCDGNGIKTEPQNGYSGYIDPRGTECQWELKNPTEPINQTMQVNTPISVDPTLDTIKTAQANNFLQVISYAQQNGFGNYLSQHGESIDLQNNPGDDRAGQKVNQWVADIIAANKDMQVRLSQPVDVSKVDQALQNATPQQKAGFFSGIVSLLQSAHILEK